MTQTQAGRAEALKKVPIFSDLSDKELRFLAERALPIRAEAGKLIFSEGQPCEGLYVVESGAVKVYKSSADGREQVLTIEGPGGSIAELPVFDGGNYPASAAAVSETRLLFVSKRDFQALCLQHPEVALKVLRVVGARLRRLPASGTENGPRHRIHPAGKQPGNRRAYRHRARTGFAEPQPLAGRGPRED
jgi:CRP-like cAMP-binding protein